MPHLAAMRTHKGLMAWQEANAVVKTVMIVTRGVRHPSIEQLQRASLSVQLNIAEGYALRSPRRFRNHLEIAYGSAVETADLLELTSELGLFPADAFNRTMQQCSHSQALLLGLIKRLRNC
jgi:four helix bundle protein